jgi:hypothetical protein
MRNLPIGELVQRQTADGCFLVLPRTHRLGHDLSFTNDRFLAA